MKNSNNYLNDSIFIIENNEELIYIQGFLQKISNVKFYYNNQGFLDTTFPIVPVVLYLRYDHSCDVFYISWHLTKHNCLNKNVKVKNIININKMFRKYKLTKIKNIY